MTVAELIKAAYANCGHDWEEDPTPAMYSQALRSLNSMLNSWSAEKLQVYGIVSGISTGGYALTPGEVAYTLGSGGDTMTPPAASIAGAIRIVTSDYVILAGDGTIFVNASGGDITITLLPSLTGTEVAVKRIDDSAYTVRVVPEAGNDLEGGTEYLLPSQWAGAFFRPDGVVTWTVF